MPASTVADSKRARCVLKSHRMVSEKRPLFTAFLALGAALASAPAHAGYYDGDEPARIEGGIAQRAILELLDFRVSAMKATAEIDAQTRAGIPLRGNQLEPLHRNVMARERIKDELILHIEPYFDLVNHPGRVKTDADLFHYLETMAIGYVLTDNYQDFVETIQKNDLLRRVANEPNLSFRKTKNLLRRTVRQLYSVKFHRPTLRGARRFPELPKDVDQKILADPDLEFFWTVIESSATFRFLRKQNDFQRVTYDVGFFFKKLFGAKKIFRDALHSSLAATVDEISKIFGNTVGLFQSRNGYLYHSGFTETAIARELRPGDVLLEKTPFRLTDKFIPGYWGHNAIWLGTEEELKALGVWEDPAIRAIASRIHAGMSILEALRPGVTTNSLAHFMDVDSLAVLRRVGMSDDERRAVILRAARQYGKAYDFGFDVETQDTLVCSELMFMTYTDIPFKLDKVLGRFTINPDSVAAAAIAAPTGLEPPGPPPFDVIVLYADGKALTGDLRAEMKRLLRPKEAAEKKTETE